MDALYPLVKGAFTPALRFGLEWRIEGLEHLPERGPVILAANHVSYLDPLTLGWVAARRGRRVRFLAKAELFDRRVLGLLLRWGHQIPVARGTRDAAAALDAASRALAAGECVAVFPEGTISEDLDPMAGKSGVARLARAAGVPVTPVGLWGTHRILTKGRPAHWQWRVPQRAVVGAPVPVAPDRHVNLATDDLMDAICTCVRRARAIYPPGGEDEWWWRAPDAAVLRSCRAGGPKPQAAS